jgi:hypothetical protein
MSTTTTTRSIPPTVTPAQPPPVASRGRIVVSEVWFDKPLPRLSQGAAYIGSGDGWKQFSVMADLDARTMIVTLPDRRVMRVPFENIVCYTCA